MHVHSTQRTPSDSSSAQTAIQYFNMTVWLCHAETKHCALPSSRRLIINKKLSLSLRRRTQQTINLRALDFALCDSDLLRYTVNPTVFNNENNPCFIKPHLKYQVLNFCAKNVLKVLHVIFWKTR